MQNVVFLEEKSRFDDKSGDLKDYLLDLMNQVENTADHTGPAKLRQQNEEEANILCNFLKLV